MVKNTFGGSKSKSFARKHDSSSHSHVIRMPTNSFEKFAIVRKLFGGSICQVFSDDLITRQAIIRGKFRGKGKRHNIISSGTLVLIGLRDFSSDNICDIIEVYSSFDFQIISQKPSFPSSIIDFIHNSNTNNNSSTSDDFIFSSSISTPSTPISHYDHDNNTHLDHFDILDI